LRRWWGNNLLESYQEEDPGKPLVFKNPSQYPEHEEEGEMLREATEMP
jgi:hypothetical protein